MAGAIVATAVLAPGVSHAGYDDQSIMATETATLSLKRVEDHFAEISVRMDETSERIRLEQEKRAAEQRANSFSRIHAVTQLSSGVWTVLMDYVTEALEMISGSSPSEGQPAGE